MKMSNSVLSLVFPLAGQKCNVSTRKLPQNQHPMSIPLQSRKLFSSSSNQTKFGLIVTSDSAASCHQRPLLFQAAITAAQSGKQAVIILPQQWNDLPFGLNDDSGVHKMSKLTRQNVERITFIYPSNLEELFRYIFALGGSSEKPDLLLIENVDEFISPTETEEAAKLTLAKLFAALNNLSTLIGGQKPFDLLISSSRKEIFSFSENYFMWVDEIWETACVDENLSMLFVDDESPFVYRLDFSHSPSTNQYFFKSISKENERDSSSPVLS
jgi:hypothetical protein